MSQPSNYKAGSAANGSKSFAVTIAALTITNVISVAPALAASYPSVSKDYSYVGGHYLSSSQATRGVTISDLLNSTAVFALLKLEALASNYPNLVANINDARLFAKSLPYDFPRPEIWTDEETEVAFEWKHGVRHAMVSFQGDSSFGYALRRGNRFVPGAFAGDLKSGVPRDLINYLSGKTHA